MRALFLSIACLLLLVSPGMAGPINLLVNGGFETGDFTGWTVSNGLYTVDYGIAEVNPHPGIYAAWFGTRSGLTFISQLIPTDPGQTYDVSFWMSNQNQGDNPQNEFQLFWGGAPVFDEINLPNTPWTFVEDTFTATASSTQIEFAFHNVPGWWTLDDVSVAATSAATPEPGGPIACGLGLAALVIVMRRAALRAAAVPK